MEVQGMAGAAPEMNQAAQANQAQQKQEEQAAQAVQNDAPKQEQSAGLAPGVGGNVNVAV